MNVRRAGGVAAISSVLLAVAAAACVGRDGFDATGGGPSDVACGPGCAPLPIGTFKTIEAAANPIGAVYMDGQDVRINAAGYPAVVWQQIDGTVGHVYYAQWNGSAWVELAGSATTGSGVDVGAGFVSLRFDSGDQPNMAWLGSGNGIFFRRFDGATWSELAGSGSGTGLGTTNSTEPALALGPDDAPIAVWTYGGAGSEIYLRRYVDPAWVELAGSASGGGVSSTASSSGYPSVATAAQGDVVVAWSEYGGGTANVYVKRYDGSSWSELAGSATGSGISGSSPSAILPSVAMDRAGHPVVAWLDSGSGAEEVYLRRYDGASWVELGGSGSGGGVSAMGLTCLSVDLALDQYDNPVVSWTVNLGSNRRAYLRRWSGTSWDGIDGSDAEDGVGRAQIGNDLDVRHDIRGDELCVMWTHGDSQSYPTVRVACTRLL